MSTPAQVATDVDTQHSRLFIHDKLTGTKFLVDTGADVSVIPPRDKCISRVFSTKIYAANGTPIDTYGDRLITVDLGLRRTFQWRFCAANVSRPIIGADFIKHFGLMVDLKNRRLIDTSTDLTSRGSLTSPTIDSVSSLTRTSSYSELLARYPEVISPTQPGRNSNCTVVHHISTTGPPVHEKPRRLPPEKAKAAAQSFSICWTMESAGHP